jgi:hypothetical protein
VTGLHVHIYDADKKQYQLPNSIWPRPEPSSVDPNTSELVFNHDPNPFAFWITRRSTGEIIVSCRHRRCGREDLSQSMSHGKGSEQCLLTLLSLVLNGKHQVGNVVAQRRSSGYSVNSVDTSATGGILASMSMNGDGCKAFGNDIANLMLSVEYETSTEFTL